MTSACSLVPRFSACKLVAAACTCYVCPQVARRDLLKTNPLLSEAAAELLIAGVWTGDAAGKGRVRVLELAEAAQVLQVCLLDGMVVMQGICFISGSSISAV